MTTNHLTHLINQHTTGWTPAQKHALTQRIQAETTRQSVTHDYPTPGDLAQAIDPKTIQTPALKLIDHQLRWALTTPDARLAISISPQEGKTTRVGIWGVLHALIENPDRRIVLASYSVNLARNTARAARNIIREYGTGARDSLTGAPLPDRLGISLAEDNASASSWSIRGHRGGMYAVGVGGSLTGERADVLIIDDPVKGMLEADSVIERQKVITWWESVAQTRLAPGAPVIIIMTRWHEDDLVGHLVKQDQAKGADTWRVVNIPAIATPGVPDALGRAPGVAMESARGRTVEDFERIRDDVGERVWSALYLGRPTPAGGGLFSAEWFARHRAPSLPNSGVAATIVSIDPAETGRRDEAGIIGLSVTSDSVAWVTDDRSGRMQSDEWARAAVLLALELRAGEILFEAFTTGQTYERVISNAWERVRKESLLLRASDGDVADAAIAYADDPQRPADCYRALNEVSMVAVPNQDSPPFRIQPWRAKGDKVARAAGTRQAASTGRLRIVGTQPELENQAVSWLPGQHSPDRMDALVNGFERCMQLVGGRTQIATPTDTVSPAPGAGFWASTIG
ncbi:terminase family protein [uncultured Corynebacterium sp.]|uniref:terminase large subunit domain-containing protein n=1 Tax=uncultured Corynebacterium sp. TaxID=159447 RepID=UPI00260E2C48|nr:terminase family protein [uncultured Corynebacterium sp.]